MKRLSAARFADQKHDADAAPPDEAGVRRGRKRRAVTGEWERCGKEIVPPLRSEGVGIAKAASSQMPLAEGPSIGAHSKRVESVTSDDRRHVLEAMAFKPDPTAFDAMLLGSLGSAAVDPVGERYPGEEAALVTLLREHAPQAGLGLRVLSDAALEVWAGAEDGSQASRTALLRSVAAFLMNDVAIALVAGMRSAASTTKDQSRRSR